MNEQGIQSSLISYDSFDTCVSSSSLVVYTVRKPFTKTECRDGTMDTSNHFTLTSLFDQLGLPSDKASINQFIQDHHLKSDQHIKNASFWSTSQAAFICEALERDGDWSEIVDILDAELHRK